MGKDAIDFLIEGWAAPEPKKKVGRPKKVRTETPSSGPRPTAPEEDFSILAPPPEEPEEPLRETSGARWKILPCGHEPIQYVRAEEGLRIRLRVLVEAPGPDTCPACKAGHPGNPRYEVGEYRRPVPESHRRVPSSGLGFPGYCTDAAGFYIGGLGNDCRFTGEKARCSVHTPSKKEH